MREMGHVYKRYGKSVVMRTGKETYIGEEKRVKWILGRRDKKEGRVTKEKWEKRMREMGQVYEG